jgi:hypothetical protein
VLDGRGQGPLFAGARGRAPALIAEVFRDGIGAEVRSPPRRCERRGDRDVGGGASSAVHASESSAKLCAAISPPLGLTLPPDPFSRSLIGLLAVERTAARLYGAERHRGRQVRVRRDDARFDDAGRMRLSGDGAAAWRGGHGGPRN